MNTIETQEWFMVCSLSVTFMQYTPCLKHLIDLDAVTDPDL